jgi:O-antigen ligase
VATTTDARRSSPRFARDWRARGGTALVVAAVVLAEVVAAAGLVVPRLTPLLLLGIAAAGGLVILQRPGWGAALAVVLVSSVFAPKVATFPIGPVEFRAYELVVGALVAAAVLVPRSRDWGGVAGGALALFLVVIALSSALAVAAGRTPFGDAFAAARVFAPLLLFFVIVRLFPDRASLDRLLLVACVAAAGTGVVALAASVGVNVEAFLGTGSGQFVDLDGQVEGARVRLPGVALAYALLWFAVLRALRAGGAARAGWIAVILGMAINLALSFNRNMWVGLIIGLGLLVFLGGPVLRRPVAVGAGVFAAAVCAAVLIGIKPEPNSPIEPIVERSQTLLDPRAVQRESSLQDRFGETQLAWKAISTYPVTGAGPGVPFGAYYNEEVAPGRYERTRQLFLHNQYLYLLLIGGVPALAAFLTFLGATLARAWSQARDLETLTLGVAVVMLMVSAVVMISFAEPNMLCALSLVTAAVVTRTRAAA